MTRREIYQALGEGETVVHITGMESSAERSNECTFVTPENWSIKDKHTEHRQAHSEGAIIEYYSGTTNGWKTPVGNSPLWEENLNYRIKGNINIKSWNKHKDVIRAFWEGKEIEFSYDNKEWCNISIPTWRINMHYRAKEQPKMYCRFKSEEFEEIQESSSYVLVGGDRYHAWLANGWEEMKHKTYQEIE